MKKRRLLLSIICILAVMIPISVFAAEDDSGYLEGPKIVFGSYPQTEIVYMGMMSGVNGKKWAKGGDYIADSSLYSKLEAASYDSNGDTTIDGTKYRRISQSDATVSREYDEYFAWKENYHYFRYEPIKWRVLKRTDDDIFLLADVALDAQVYHKSMTDITWDNSDMRIWLNRTFYDRAFSETEQNVIKTTELENVANLEYGTKGGANTQDKIFLLSESEIYGTGGEANGFASAYNAEDIARKAKSSTYAKAMGVATDTSSTNLGNCKWWLRSPGCFTSYAMYVQESGGVSTYGSGVDMEQYAVRPVLHIDLSSYDPAREKINIEDVKISSGNLTYDGTEKKPAVSMDGLSKGTDYTVEYKNNIDGGRAEVLIKGIGDYSGEIVKHFTINPAANVWTKELSIENWTCGEEASQPVAESKYGTVTFTYSTDQDGDFSENVPSEPGVYYVKASVEAAANYIGLEQTMSFQINKNEQQIADEQKVNEWNDIVANLPDVAALTRNDVEKVQSAINTYKAFTDEQKKLVNADTLTKLEALEAQLVKWDQEAKEKAATKKAQDAFAKKSCTLYKLKKLHKLKIRVYWKSVSKVDGYQVQYSLSKKFSSKTKYRTKKVNFKGYTKKSGTISKLKANKRYYVRVRLYKKIGGKTIYSKWSKVKYATAKK